MRNPCLGGRKMKADVYERITGQIVAELEKGVRPWFKPWNAEHAAGRITRPLRSNGIPYRGINVLMLWSEAMTKGFAAPMAQERPSAQTESRSNAASPTMLTIADAKKALAATFG